MSLRVWLPLNGDLHNQGLSDVTVTNNGATINNAGKIGKCYSFAKNAYLDIDKSAMTDMTSASVCFWIKVNSWNTNWDTVFQAGTGATPWTAYYFGVLRNSSNSLCFAISNGSSGSQGAYKTDNLTVGEWCHVVCSYGDGKCRTYLNGELCNEYNATIVPNFSGITSIKVGGLASNYKCDCLLNDVRIYDEAISTKLVKELSKGLILHYPLNRGGFGGDNLLKDSNEPVTNSSYCIKSYYFGDDPPQEGEEVTIQIKGRLADTKSYWSVYNSGGSVNVIALLKSSYNEATGIYTATGNWVITKGTITATNKFINVYTITSSQSGESTIEWIKMERGSTATPWVPNSADALYSAMGLDDGIEYDVSGYQNNGTKTGTITVSSDTPRYNVSTLFNGSASYYTLDRPLYDFFNNDFTIAVWLKPLDKTRGIILSEYPTTGASLVSLELSAAPALRLYWGGSPDWTIASTALTVGEWSHIAVSKDDTHAYFYVNGELKDTKTGTFANRVSNARPRIGDDYRGGTSVSYNGGMSDLRLYSTCLSADDILSLYHTPVSIANRGTLLTQGEIVEV